MEVSKRGLWVILRSLRNLVKRSQKGKKKGKKKRKGEEGTS